MTPQEIMKKFVSAFNEVGNEYADEINPRLLAMPYTNEGTLARINLIREAVVDRVFQKFGFEDMQDFINKMVAESKSLPEFLKSINIVLDNEDTGGILGSDAGNGLVTKAEDIVKESVPVSEWTLPAPGSSKTLSNGITVVFPTAGADGQTFTESEKFILKGLNSTWLEDCFNLIDDSLGLNFTNDSASTKTLYIRLTVPNKAIGQKESWAAWSNPIKIKDWTYRYVEGLEISFNVNYFNNLDFTDENGKLLNDSTGKFCLDRTCAHELAHAAGYANIQYYSLLPNWIKEGLSDILLGDDDNHTQAIRNFTTSQQDKLDSILKGDDDSDHYTAGYLALRYLADRCSNDYVKSFNGTDKAEHYQTSRDYVTIASNGGNDTIESDGNKNSLNGGAGDDSIVIGGTDNTIVGGEGNNVISLTSASQNSLILYGGGLSTIHGTKATDTLSLSGGTAYTENILNGNLILSMGAGSSITLIGARPNIIQDNFQNVGITLKSSASDTIICGNDNADSIVTTGDRIKIQTGWGNDTIKNGSYETGAIFDGGNNVFTDAGNGDNYTYNKSGENITMVSGNGNDRAHSYEGDSVQVSLGAGDDYFNAYMGKNISVFGGEDNDKIYANGGEKLYYDGGAGNDLLSLYNGTKLTTLVGGAGQDTLNLQGATQNLIIHGEGDGGDLILNIGATDTISLFGEYTSSLVGADLLLINGNDTITVQSGGNVDFTILKEVPENKLIVGTEGVDTFNNTLEGATINALGGNDSITNNADNVSINAGEGINTINVVNSSNVTIDSSEGETQISLSGSKNTSINHHTFQHNMTISGFDWATDTLDIGSDFSTKTVGDDYEISAGFSKVVLKDCASIPTDLLTIKGFPHGSAVEPAVPYNTINNSDSFTLISGSTYFGVQDNKFTNTGANVTIRSGDKKDWVTNNGNGASISTYDDKDQVEHDAKNAPATIDTGADDDVVIISNGMNVSVNGNSGNDSIKDSGQGHDMLLGGEGDDTIISEAQYVTILGGAGDDFAKVFGSYNFVEAGADNNRIYLLGGVNSTVNLKEGTNIVYNDKTSKENVFNVTGGNSTLTGLTDNSSLIFGNGSDTYTKETLDNGCLLFKTDTASVTARYSSDFQIFGTEKIVSEEPEWSINENMASYGTKSKFYFTLSGLNPKVKISDLSFNKNTNVITLSGGALGKDTVELLAEVDTPYKLALADDVKISKTLTAAQYDSSNMIYRTKGTTTGYTLANNKISYVEGTSKSFTFEGVADGATASNFYLSGSNLTIGLAAVKTDGTAVKLTDTSDGGSYNLKLGRGMTSSRTLSAAEYDSGVYQTKGITNVGYELSDDKQSIKYNTAEAYAANTSKSFTFEGVADGATASNFYLSGSNLTIGLAAVKTDGTAVKLTDTSDGGSYNLKLGRGMTASRTLSAAEYDSGVYQTKGITNVGYELSDDKQSIKYNTAEAYAANTSKSFTFEGVADGATASNFYLSGSNLTIGLAAVKTDGTAVKLTDTSDGGSYNLKLGRGMTASRTLSAAEYDSGVYQTKGITNVGYELSDDKQSIKYNTEKAYAANTSKSFTFEGVADGATASNFYLSGSNLTIGLAAVKTDGTAVKLTDTSDGGSYNLKLGKGMTASRTLSAAEYDSGVYQTKGITNVGYELSNDKQSIKYNTAEAYAANTSKSFTFTGVADGAEAKNFYLSGSNITIGLAAVKTDGTAVKLTDTSDGEDYNLKLGKGMTAAKKNVSLSNGKYTVTYSTTGYNLNNAAKEIKYVAKNETALELSGITKAPTGVTTTNGVASLQTATFNKATVTSNAADYFFAIESGTYTGKTFTGSANADTVTNAGASLTINLGNGNDSIISTGNNVTINGGAGNDYIKSTGAGSSVLGGAGADTIACGGGADTIDAGAANDIVWGGSGADSIFGNSGNDSLNGAAGNDSLWGGAGNDTLTGGAGADTFIYRPSEGTDTITDYNNSQGDILRILKADGTSGTYTGATFASNKLTLTIDDGSVIFNNVKSGSSININGTTHKISGNTLK